MKSCTCESLRSQREFKSIGDFREFQQILKASELEEIPVTQPDLGLVGFVEQWYRCPTCKRGWVLTHPSPPYLGEWYLR